MNNKIQISNGGSVTIGNIIQGNEISTGNILASATLRMAIETAKSALQQLADQGAQSQSDVAQVKRHVDELGEEAQQDVPSTGTGIKIIETIRRNFSWAYPIIKDLIAKAWPALSGSI